MKKATAQMESGSSGGTVSLEVKNKQPALDPGRHQIGTHLAINEKVEVKQKKSKKERGAKTSENTHERGIAKFSEGSPSNGKPNKTLNEAKLKF
mmetsp:Transcript_21729/g.33526  ORF Transcript_21729/g.33526 Transcript_21729/m.33526 type:complete len:94 (+) Transcript_21729:6301-6582(+)